MNLVSIRKIDEYINNLSIIGNDITETKTVLANVTYTQQEKEKNSFAYVENAIDMIYHTIVQLSGVVKDWKKELKANEAKEDHDRLCDDLNEKIEDAVGFVSEQKILIDNILSIDKGAGLLT